MKSVVLADMHHAYAQTDGTYAFPNSREGDMLKQAKKEIEALIEQRDAARRIADIEMDKTNDVKEQRDGAIKAVRGLLKLVACCVHITVKEHGKKSLQSDVRLAWGVLEADAKRRGVVLDENWMVDP